MKFNKHSDLVGSHAFLSASKYHWINYDEEKLTNSYLNFTASELGTRLHELANELILLKVKLPRSNKTLNMFVNDAIGYKMETEQVLYYSMNCFGTADAISFRDNLLRIHDLKTGVSPTSMNQLEVYAALFCLEYKKNPIDISFELRIYQSNECFVHVPEKDNIIYIMDKIVQFDKHIEKIKGTML